MVFCLYNTLFIKNSVKAPLHSKKSLLRSLEKIKKPKPYFKAEIGIDDYILYHKYDYVENKYDRPNSDIGSNMNIAKINVKFSCYCLINLNKNFRKVGLIRLIKP